MILNHTFELSMIVDTDHFQRIFTNKTGHMRELDGEYIDTSLVEKGITVIYRDSRYKKKVRLLINAGVIVDDPSDTNKLLHKLDKRVAEYFDHKYRLDDFILSGVNLILDINVGSHANVSGYLQVLQRVGKVKGFSPVDYEFLDGVNNLCLSGHSNDIDFLLYDLSTAIMSQRKNADTGRKLLKSMSSQVNSIIRAEVRLMKPKAIRAYTDAADVSGQIVEMIKDQQRVFLDTFARIIPFGDFQKKAAAVEIIRSEVKDSIMRRRMLRLLALIPEKKSLHLAQKAMNCREVDKVMEAFARINLSPVTLSKRHDVKHLENLYSFFL